MGLGKGRKSRGKMIFLFYFSSRDFRLQFFLCHRWQQMFCENMNVEFSIKYQYTPGPRLMRIHLVRYSTSARSGKVPQIFT